MKKTQANAHVIDLFCGAGGLSHGFLKEGFKVVAGVDIDEACRFPFEKNNEAPFLSSDIQKVSGHSLNKLFGNVKFKILVGCAPCQPFSSYTKSAKGEQWRLVKEFIRLVREIRPHVVSMENVPRLTKFKHGNLFEELVKELESHRYTVYWEIADCVEFGIPQTRKRLVLLASRLGPIKLQKPKTKKIRTVKDTIYKLPKLKAGQIDKRDPLHRSSRLSDINMKRIKASVQGGTWRNWKGKLRAKCHTKKTGKSYPSVYGRMSWNEPSPTITTQFHGFGNGRFGHPQQNRAISLREGALLQTFPASYKFINPSEDAVAISKIGRLIGNAVPVALGRVIAASIRTHIGQHE